MHIIISLNPSDVKTVLNIQGWDCKPIDKYVPVTRTLSHHREKVRANDSHPSLKAVVVMED
jgi:hypothetical protein